MYSTQIQVIYKPMPLVEPHPVFFGHATPTLPFRVLLPILIRTTRVVQKSILVVSKL